MEKTEKCAWCGAEPEIRPDFGDVFYSCGNGSCVIGCHMHTLSGMAHWNRVQLAILEQRRKDFEAGAEFVNKWKLEVQDQVPVWKIREVFNAIVNGR